MQNGSRVFDVKKVRRSAASSLIEETFPNTLSMRVERAKTFASLLAQDKGEDIQFDARGGDAKIRKRRNNLRDLGIEAEIGGENEYVFAGCYIRDGPLAKAACKVYLSVEDDEVAPQMELMKVLSNFVRAGHTQGFPLYMGSRAIHMVHSSKVHTGVFRELAHTHLGDRDFLASLVKRPDCADVIRGIICQLCHALCAVNRVAEFCHQGLDLKEILIHRVDPGGYWEYRLGSDSYYVPNNGVFPVISGLKETHLWTRGDTSTHRLLVSVGPLLRFLAMTLNTLGAPKELVDWMQDSSHTPFMISSDDDPATCEGDMKRAFSSVFGRKPELDYIIETYGAGSVEDAKPLFTERLYELYGY